MASTLKVVGRSASLELAHLGPPFHRHLDQRVHEVHSGAPVQKISASAENGSFNPCARHFGHNFCIFLYIQFIGVHWRVPSGLVARQNVFGKGAGPAGLVEAGRPATSAEHESETCDLHNFSVRTPNWVIQMSNSIISMSSSTWQYQIWLLTLSIMVSSCIHVSRSLYMLYLVLFFCIF